VILMRKRLLDDIRRVEEGQDPSGLIRDPERSKSVELPTIGKLGFRNGMSRATLERVFAGMGHRFPPGYLFQVGQPEHVRREYEDAMGCVIAE
jgi:5,5'-dehydrodivanillate O-demethylase